MKVLFLDFDGVINTFHSHTKGDGDTFSKLPCKNLNKLLSKVPDLQIVVSSAWRMHGVVRVVEILQKNGIDPTRVAGITGDEPGPRGVQIQHWLNRNPTVTNIVIIDDDSDMEHLMNKLVKTNSFVGLTTKDVDSAVEILNKPLK